MRTILMISLTVMLIASCGYRMLDNGHRVSRPAPNRAADSIPILNLGETIRLPDTRAVISLTIAKAPCQSPYGYSLLLADTRAEAARLGGNFVKVDHYGGFSRNKLYSTIYLLEPSDLTRLKDSLAAVLAAHRDSIRNVAVVHIKDYDLYAQRYIQFNHSLIDSVKGRRIKTLILHSDGFLKLGENYLTVRKGNEYFVVLTTPRIGRYTTTQKLALTDKTHFENRNLILEWTP
jgi:hypothetical protein